jgi:hypothetical protein
LWRSNSVAKMPDARRTCGVQGRESVPLRNVLQQKRARQRRNVERVRREKRV